MLYVIVGHPDSGKSKMAEELVLRISEEGHRVYLATMIPYGEEGQVRIERHRRLREGKGFLTIEEPMDLKAAVIKMQEAGRLPQEETLLLECLSNLLANRLFDGDKRSDIGFDPETFAGDRQERGLELEAFAETICQEVLDLKDKVKDLIVVTNEFPLEDPGYDEDTRQYTKAMHLVNERICKDAEEVRRI